MEITEVRVKLVERSSERLRAFCSITLDSDFVIRDLKIIDGANGAFVAMPSRKLSDRCPKCGCKNHLRAKYCNECGQKLNENRAPKDSQGRAKLHADVAHPINAKCRERIQKAVIEAFNTELEKAKSPDYCPPDLDDFDENDENNQAPEVQVKDSPVAVKHNTPDKQEDDDTFSDYDSLIADLKREAAGRRSQQGNRQPDASRVSPPISSSRPQADRPPSVINQESDSQTTAETTFSDADSQADSPQANQTASTDNSLNDGAKSSAPTSTSNSPPPKDEDDDFGAGL
ncbi:MAG: septation protein SpoVG family protein [Planctomycetota bacterium]|nr:MAG: septation protein SpoVG family protein [Planctomycetota bacterium]